MSVTDKIIANLEAMSGGVADAVEKAVLRELKRVQADAKRLAPVETGHLRMSITTDVKCDTNGDIIGAVGSNLEYAAAVEFGSGPVGEANPRALPEGVSPAYRKDGWTYFDKKTNRFVSTKGQPARPFLYPAFKQNESRVKDNIARAIQRALKGGGNND